MGVGRKPAGTADDRRQQVSLIALIFEMHATEILIIHRYLCWIYAIAADARMIRLRA